MNHRIPALIGLTLWGSACASGETVTLGELFPAPIFTDFVGDEATVVTTAVGRPVRNINGADDDENPSLTADLLEIFFTSRREEGPGSGDIWTARRASRSEKFSPPELVLTANSEFTETSSAISLDGLTLWFGSNRPGAMGGEADFDIWTMRRSSRDAAWRKPQLAESLNSTQKDIPRPPGGGGLTMPLASERDSPGYYQTYLAQLTPEGTAVSPPVLLSGLVSPEQSVVDAFLTADGLGIFYNREQRDGNAELQFGWRWAQGEPFANSIALDAINTEANDRDPWLSPDEELLFFTTDRRGNDEIFATQLRLPARR